MTSATSVTSITPAALPQQRDGLVAQQPHTYVRQIEMVALQVGQRLHAGLLQHPFQHVGTPATADKHAVVLGHRGVEPQPVADDIGIGDRLQGLVGADEHVATDHHRMNLVRRHRHDLLVERQLQTQQILRQPLTTLPTEHGYRCQNLARRGIAGQSAALSAGMEQDTLLSGEPVAEVFSTVGTLALLQQPDRSAPAAEPVPDRITGAEIRLAAEPRHVMKAPHQIRWQ